MQIGRHRALMSGCNKSGLITRRSYSRNKTGLPAVWTRPLTKAVPLVHVFTVPLPDSGIKTPTSWPTFYERALLLCLLNRYVDSGIRKEYSQPVPMCCWFVHMLSVARCFSFTTCNKLCSHQPGLQQQHLAARGISFGIWWRQNHSKQKWTLNLHSSSGHKHDAKSNEC